MKRKYLSAFIAALLACLLTATVSVGCRKKKETFAVTYAGGEGAVGTAPSDSALYAEGESVILKTNTFTKEGYVFTFWNDGVMDYAAGATYTMPARSVTFTAKWTVIQTPPEKTYYTVNFFNGTTLVDTKTVEEGSAVTLPEAPAAATGKEFGGWYVMGTDREVTSEFIPTAYTEVEARWKDVTVEPPKPVEPDPDTEDPVITFDMDSTLQAESSMQVKYTATDNIGVTSVNITVKKDGTDVTASVYNSADKTFTPTEAGNYEITAEAFDAAGNSATKTHTVTVTAKPKPVEPDPDTEDPVIAFDMESSLLLGSSMQVKYTATDNIGVTGIRISVKKGGTDVTAAVYNSGTKTFTPTEEGEYGITVEALDGAGNSATKTHTVTVTAKPKPVEPDPDTENPVITFDMENTLQAGNSMQVKYTATDNVGVTSVKITVTKEDTDVTAAVYDNAAKTFTPTEAGEYIITAEARDEAGNTAIKSHTVTVTEAPKPVEPDPDTEEPVITFDMENTLQAGNSMQVKYTATDNVGVTSVKITVTKEGSDVTAVVYDSAAKTFTPTEAGEYIITAEACDEAGNTATKTHTVTVSAAPVEPDPEYTLPQDPNFGNGVSVHDPSVYYDNVTEKYYVFGSHFAAASSTDLIHWKQEAWDGDSGKQLLYGTTDFRSVLKETNRIIGGDQNTWAPDVEKINGKYYMYYSLTSGFGSNKSLIGRVSSNNVLGPYSNEEVIIWSEGKDSDPNCIDPELFYDKSGGLWMVYGSWFAGIYVKQLDPATGLPVSGENGVHDYGKLVWKGEKQAVEGPYIFYNAETDYYYLMTSYGELAKDYNMRIARSKNPNGPYQDVTGKDMASGYGGGNKLAGNYQFAEDTVGYAALGHNSVIKVDGKYFVVYHTRYREGTGNNVSGGHNLQVNQLFFNRDGWPVLSPNRYAGETLGKISDSDLVGNYDIILHTEGTTVEFASSVRYTLAEGGVINRKSESVGSWSISGEHFIEIELNHVTYQGVIAPAWCTYGNKGILCFTAVSGNGRSLWANRAVSDSDVAVSGLNIIQTIDGDASNKQIEKFDTSKGFAVSFYLKDATSDWNSETVGTAGHYEITLPNLDAFLSEGVLAGVNVHPNGSIDYRTFLNQECYVTVSVSESAIAYYKNGAFVKQYARTDAINKPQNGVDIWSAYPNNVGTFIDLLLQDVKTSGFTFAREINATDLILSEAVTETQAAALYHNYSA